MFKLDQLFFLIFCVMLIILLGDQNTQIIKLNCKNEIENMKLIERKYKKLYPIGKDFFSLTHYPNYVNFFDQFINYKYFVMRDNNHCKHNFNNVIATCCISKINNLWYICDLKSFFPKYNTTYKFGKHIFLNYILTLKIKPIFFGIVMEPNKIINHIKNKYYFKKYETLCLYQIKYNDFVKNIKIMNEIFPNNFLVEGFKKLLLQSTGKFLNIYHIAQSIDSKYVKIQNKANVVNPNNAEVLFCLPEKSIYIEKLNKFGVMFSSKMSVIGYNCEHVNDWSFIKSYMI